jgi:hypothetical protein
MSARRTISYYYYYYYYYYYEKEGTQSDKIMNEFTLVSLIKI